MAERNRHGLGRTIPSAVRREVRKRCGFGCVICGLSLYDYEHFAPDFKDAEEHNPGGITLLCMQCNQKRNRKVLSVETVAAANKAPKCLQQGYANEAFDFGSKPITVEFAGVTFSNCEQLITVFGIPVLSIKEPEHHHEPFRLSGRFCDDAGAATLKIEDNVWSVGADCSDVECVGPRIIIRKEPREIVLQVKSEPPERLVIERLNMEFEGVFLRGSQNVLETSFDGKNWNKFQACSMSNCCVGMAFN